MTDIAHLHTNERVLLLSRQSRGALVRGVIDGVWQGSVLGIVLGVMISGLIALNTGEFSWAITILLVLISIAALIARHIYIWRATTIAITDTRILINSYHLTVSKPQGDALRYRSLFRAHTQTVRWDQYQESVYTGNMLHRMGNTGTLTIRYGSADGSRSATMDNLSYAMDIKHYLDKIHSLRASNTPSDQLPPFIPAKRGKRD